MKTNLHRYRFPKITVFGITVIFILIIILTVSLFYKDSTRECAQGFLRVEIFAFVVQLLLNYVNFRSQNKIIVLATLFASSMVLFSVLLSFFNFQMMCELYPAF